MRGSSPSASNFQRLSELWLKTSLHTLTPGRLTLPQSFCSSASSRKMKTTKIKCVYEEYDRKLHIFISHFVPQISNTHALHCQSISELNISGEYLEVCLHSPTQICRHTHTNTLLRRWLEAKKNKGSAHWINSSVKTDMDKL